MSIAGKIEAVREGRKAISHHPELEHRVHVSSSRAKGVSTELNKYADYGGVYEIYTWVRKAVGLLAETIAPLPVRVVGRDGEELEAHKISELLSYINDQSNPSQYWEAWVVDMMLAGESFSQLILSRAGDPLELWTRRPDQVEVFPDKSNERKWYPRVAHYTWGEDELVIEPEFMVHDKFYNPLNNWRGLAPIRAIREGITIDLFAQAWSKTFLRRGARPDHAIITPQGLTPTERRELEENYQDDYGGPENWHKPIFLESGVQDVKPIAFSPADIQWLAQRQVARDEVAAIFGVPDEIMGFGRDTYENFDKAYEVLWKLTVTKLARHRDTSFTHFFGKVRSDLGPGERVETDFSGVGVLQEDMKEKLEQAAIAFGLGVSFNTADDRLNMGFGEIEGGEVGYLPAGLLPVSDIGIYEEGTPKGEEEKRFFPIHKIASGVPVMGSPRHQALWRQHVARLRPFEKRIALRLKREFQRQQNVVLSNLRNLGKSWAKMVVEGKATGITIGDLVDWTDEEKEWIENFNPDFEECVAIFGHDQIEELQVGFAFDVQNPEVAQAVRQMVIQFAKDINATTQERMVAELRDVLAEADSGGWGIPDIQQAIYDRISTVYNVRKSPYETERIARTEMNKAANMGQIAGMRQSGVVKKKDGWPLLTTGSG